MLCWVHTATIKTHAYRFPQNNSVESSNVITKIQRAPDLCSNCKVPCLQQTYNGRTQLGENFDYGVQLRLVQCLSSDCFAVTHAKKAMLYQNDSPSDGTPFN